MSKNISSKQLLRASTVSILSRNIDHHKQQLQLARPNDKPRIKCPGSTFRKENHRIIELTVIFGGHWSNEHLNTDTKNLNDL